MMEIWTENDVIKTLYQYITGVVIDTFYDHMTRLTGCDLPFLTRLKHDSSFEILIYVPMHPTQVIFVSQIYQSEKSGSRMNAKSCILKEASAILNFCWYI